MNAIFFLRWLWGAAENFDIVHVHNVFGMHFIIAVAVCRMRKRPYVLSPHGHLDRWFMEKSKLKKKLFMWLLGERYILGSAAVVATSELNRENIEKYCPGAKVSVITPCVADSDFKRNPDAAAKEPLKFLYLGRMDVNKNVRVLILACNHLKEKGKKKFSLSIFGWGKHEHVTELMSLAEELGLSDCLRWGGVVVGDQKMREISEHDVMVVSSFSECFSYSGAESISACVPPVVTEGVGIRDLVEKYDCGSVVPCDDAMALAEELERYFQQEYLSTRSRNCDHAMEHSLKASRMALLYTDLYIGIHKKKLREGNDED